MEQFLTNFLQFNVGNIVTILAFIIGGISFVNTMKIRQDSLAERFAVFEQKVAEDISELRKTVVSNARLEERVAAMDQRLIAHGQRVDAQGERLTSLDQRVNTMNNYIVAKYASP